jgi:tRNA pseudouridine38-40 synthase
MTESAQTAMHNILITLEYEGTNYLGWARQPHGLTIQEALETALREVTGEDIHVRGSGRTDAGVHARGHAANFKTRSTLAPERLRGALNALLPRDIAVLEAMEVPESFHARFAAKSKLYEYTIWNQRVRPALERKFCWHVRWEIDPVPMQEAAAMIVGKHDFAAFRSSNTDIETSVRTMHRAEWLSDGPRLTFRIEGDAFLYNMVRALVGTLVDVGRGKITPAQFGRILESKDRTLAGRTAPAQGLCLVRVDYDPALIVTPP